LDACTGGFGERLARAASPSIPTAEYKSHGNSREAVSYSQNFNEVHTNTYHAFINGLENELKTGNYTLSSFEIEIGEVNGLYYVLYRINLNPATSPDSRHTTVDMRGTILTGSTLAEAKSNVLAANHDKFYTPDNGGDDWIARMHELVQKEDTSKRIWEEDAEASFKEGNLYWYHAAKLIKGN